MNNTLRYELKYALDQNALAKVTGWVNSRMGPVEKHPPRVVNSIYFDTPLMQGMTENMIGLPSRNKYRLRWYNDQGSELSQGCRFEIKTRKNRLNSKMQFTIDCFGEGLTKHRQCSVRAQLIDVLKTMNGAPRLANLFPTLQVQYLRQYYEDMQGLRITLDTNIIFYQTPLNGHLFFGHGVKHLASVLEIKCPEELSYQAAKLIKPLNISAKRHSKYIAGLAAFGIVKYI